MSPYRISSRAEPTPVRGRTAAGRFRSWMRALLVYWNGRFKERYPVTCPCGRRSWDPNALRSGGAPYSMNAGRFYVRANSYRCGQRHDLRNVVRLG